MDDDEPYAGCPEPGCSRFEHRADLPHLYAATAWASAPDPDHRNSRENDIGRYV